MFGKRLTRNQIIEIIELYQGGKRIMEISRELNISRSKISRWIHRRNNLEQYTYFTLELVGDDSFRCAKCNDIKLLSERWSYTSSYCKGCRSNQQSFNLYKSPESYLRNKFLRTKIRCRKKGIFFNIEYQDVLSQYYKQKGKCFFSGIKMILAEGLRTRDCCSIDRVIPKLGYSKGNIVLCTHRMNTLKGDLSLDELKFWIPKMYRKVIKFLKQ